MTLSPHLQQLVAAARDLDAQPPDLERRMWTTIAAALEPSIALVETQGAASPIDATVPVDAPRTTAAASAPAPAPAVTTHGTAPSSGWLSILKIAAVSSVGIGIVVGVELGTARERVAAVPLSRPVTVAIPAPTVRPAAPLQHLLATTSPPAPPAVSTIPARPRTAAPSPSTVPPRTPVLPPKIDKKPPTDVALAVDSDRLADETRMLRRARALVFAARFDDALQVLAQHAQTFPAGALREARMALEVEALCGAGRSADAEVASKRLSSAFPRSALRSTSWCTR